MSDVPLHNSSVTNGPYGILVTPFKRDGTVDFDGLARNMSFALKTRIKGLVPCGSTGEFIKLSFDENVKIMELATSISKGKKTIISGATAADTKTTLRYMYEMGKLGHEAALVAPPYYFKYADEEIVSFYRELKTAGLPVVAYNIPVFTNAISLNAYERMLEFEHVTALKNSSANIKEIMHQIEIKEAHRPEFDILTGTDDSLLPSLLCGCSGSFTALGSILPESICGIYNAVADENLSIADSLQKQLLPILRLADSFTFPFGYKLLAKARGLAMGRSGWETPETKEHIDESLEKMKALIDKLNQEEEKANESGSLDRLG